MRDTLIATLYRNEKRSVEQQQTEEGEDELFAITRFLATAENSQTKDEASSVVVKGSIGYVPPGSRVSATCMDKCDKVIYYGSDEMDEEGEFDMVVDSREACKELRPELCFVRLVSSPNPVCNVATNFGGGKSE
ncbi:hypothetical protein Syun_019825 [Stephania yunnanensis]|uniref:Uncharacterized protein n=1 Tax=Stephania yunnanensis TaxID=152371 RepID=A0AAP0IWI8_9MAGN